MKYFWLFIFIFFMCQSQAQIKNPSKKEKTANDSIKKAEFLNNIGNGYYPTMYINFDLRYLI